MVTMPDLDTAPCMAACPGAVLELPGPYTSTADVSQSITLPSQIRITVSITTGSDPSSDGILIMGQGGQCAGNLYAWIGGSGNFHFGVQCNGQSSDGALGSTTVVQPNTDYDLAFLYDGSIAKIYVNGVLEAEGAKTFNYFGSPTSIAVGAGAR